MTKQPCNTTIPICSSPVCSRANRINRHSPLQEAVAAAPVTYYYSNLDPNLGIRSNLHIFQPFPASPTHLRQPPCYNWQNALTTPADPWLDLRLAYFFFCSQSRSQIKNYFTMTTHQSRPSNQTAHTRIMMTYFRGSRRSVKSHIAIAPLPRTPSATRRQD